MKVKLQPPSSTELPAFNPIMPPAAITQILLLANPQKVLFVHHLLFVCLQENSTGEIFYIVAGDTSLA